MTTVDTIAQAIKEKKALEFAYHGFDRVVVPYACGLTPTNEIKMIGFQIGGGSNSGVTEKLFFYLRPHLARVAFPDPAYREASGDRFSFPPRPPPEAVFAQLSKIYEQI